MIAQSENYVLNSILLSKQLYKCQTPGWQWMYIWSSYWCIFSTYHMIGKKTFIHLLYFLNLRNSIPTLVGPTKLSWEQAILKIHEEFSNSSRYVQYSVWIYSGYHNRLCQLMNF